MELNQDPCCWQLKIGFMPSLWHRTHSVPPDTMFRLGNCSRHVEHLGTCRVARCEWNLSCFEVTLEVWSVFMVLGPSAMLQPGCSVLRVFNGSPALLSGSILLQLGCRLFRGPPPLLCGSILLLLTGSILFPLSVAFCTCLPCSLCLCYM
jgi:hypothetical protein